ncbi:MAG: hypothetical protein NTW21_11175 [Verrucomicrobia bacterium]|nr:hypothetical protein [Verrucomicrobiota bacterium]
MTRDELIAKIHKVEALFKSTESQGEMQAARGALERLQAQLAAVPQPLVEFRFSLTDPWKRQLFLALVRRHGLQPYRRPRQRYATVMVRLQRKFLDESLWPEYLQLSQLLHDYLNDATRDVISRAVHRDLSEAAEMPGLGEAQDAGA